MTLGKSLWAAAAGLTAGAVVALRRSTVRSADPAAADRWLTVTINRSPAGIQADKLPTPLQEYGDRIETRIRPAPGDRGTEVAVRLKDVPSDASSVPSRLTGQDPRQDLRRSLCEAKALLEAGEVLLPDTPPTTHDTVGGKLVGLGRTGAAGGAGTGARRAGRVDEGADRAAGRTAGRARPGRRGGPDHPQDTAGAARPATLRTPGPPAPPAPKLPDHPAYQQIMAVFTAAGHPRRARQVCDAMDLTVAHNNINNIRLKLKRLTDRGILAEIEQGLFTQPRP